MAISLPAEPPPHPWYLCFLDYKVDAGHVTCFHQWGSSKHDISRDSEGTHTLELAQLLLLEMGCLQTSPEGETP